MGFTFKENVPDTRNTKVADLVRELGQMMAEVVVYDPHADPAEARHEYGIAITNDLPAGPFDGVVLAVAHKAIAAMGAEAISGLLPEGKPGLIYDLKWTLPADTIDARL
jgi:UDP-N-acetyl-D-galactosamine dehydrogenase